MFSRHTAAGLLTHITGEQAIFAEPTAYVALFTTAPSNDSGTGAAEPTGGGYARVATSAASWNAAIAHPPLISNAAAITFPTATASWGTIVAAGLYDAATAGNLLFWDWLGAHSWRPGTVSAASPAVIDMPAHGYIAGENIVYSTVFGGLAPSFSQSSLSGLLTVAAPVLNDTFTVTNGATAVDTSAAGSGFVRRVVPLQVPAGVFVNFRPGTLVLMMTGAVPAPLAGRVQVRASATGIASTGGSSFVLGSGTSSTDALGTGTGSSDLLGVQ